MNKEELSGKIENRIREAFSIVFLVIMLCGLMVEGIYHVKPDAVQKRLITLKNPLIDLNGQMAKSVNMRGYYGNEGIYIADGDYVVSQYNETSTDYEYEQVTSFRDFLSDRGIKLLYVNEPGRYLDDDIIIDQFGKRSYLNANMDKFLSRIRQAGIAAVDLREDMVSEGISERDLFYRTDHHFDVPAGKWAAMHMAQGLNDYCDYDIDLTIYDDDKYDFTYYEKSWLGEQGRKVGKSYVGLDDYTAVRPLFETDYTFYLPDGSTLEGDFNTFINDSTFTSDMDVYSQTSWHYAYKQIHSVNNNVQEGKVLILGDSYEQVTVPFLSLAVHELDCMVLRGLAEDFSLLQYIEDNDYDTVIIAYAQMMMGAQDNEASGNYDIYNFMR